MPKIYLLIIFILLSSYFSGIEIAVYCINRVRLQYRVERGGRRAKIVKRLLDDPQVHQYGKENYRDWNSFNDDQKTNVMFKHFNAISNAAVPVFTAIA